MDLIAEIKETLDGGDPMVRSWPLISSYYYPFILSALYVLVIKRLLPAYMKNRKPYDLRLLMILYNCTVVLIYTACLLTLLFLFVSTDAYKSMCIKMQVRIGHFSYTSAIAAWYIYILKYIEYADTVFFVLRKKDHLVTNLHVIHHAVLPLIGWVMIRTETTGFQFIPTCINTFIHMIMYSYYALAAMGPQVQKYLWWKEYLTILQMLQFVVILMFMFVVVPITGCTTSKHGVYLDITFASLFLALFYNFYRKTYKSKKARDIGKNGVVSSNGINGIHENGVKGIHENGVKGIHENGVNGIYENGVNGIHENGVSAIHENGVNGIKSVNGVNGVNEIKNINGIHDIKSTNGVSSSNGVNGTHKNNGVHKKEN